MSKDRVSQLVPWLLALLWAIGAVVILLWLSDWRVPSSPSEWVALATVLVPTVVIGAISGIALLYSRDLHLSIVGLVLGYLVVIAPAVRVGTVVAIIAASVGANLGGFWIAQIGFIAGFAMASLLVLIPGALLGAGVAIVVRRLFGPFVAPMFTEGVARTLLRPRVIRPVALLGVLVGIAIYGWPRLEYRWLMALPDEPRSSPWIAREQELFRDVVAYHHYDVLVVPLQVRSPSVDRIARSLMTRMLSEQIRTRSKLTVPDPTWTARALGANARTFADTDVTAMAEAINARMVVNGYVNRSPDNRTLTVEIEVRTRESGGTGWHTTYKKEWPGLVFSDELPPSAAFAGIVDRMVDELPLGTPVAPWKSAHVPALPADVVASLPPTADAGARTPVEEAARLQLFATLHQPEDLEAAQLWERSLIALWRASEDSVGLRLLKARAYLHLYRRPAALAVLGTPANPAEAALYALLQGDLLSAQEQAARIENDWQRLTAEIEMEDLRFAYGQTVGYEERRKAVLAKYTRLIVPLQLRFSQPAWFSPELPATVADELARLGVSTSAGGVPNYLERGIGMLSWLYFCEDHHSPYSRLAVMVERTYPAVWRRNVARWAEMNDPAALNEWDYYDLLYAVSRAAALKSVSAIKFNQDLPGSALKQIGILESTFDGYAPLAYVKAAALWTIGEKSPEARHTYHEKSERVARDVYLWEGGETQIASRAEWYIRTKAYTKYDDEPPRPYRQQYVQGELVFNEVRAPRLDDRRLAYLTRRVAYAVSDFSAVEDLVKYLRSTGQTDHASNVILGLGNRFAGSSRRSKFLSAFYRQNSDPGAAIAYLRGELKVQPEEWNNYYELARLLCELGRWQEAQSMVLDFPLFKNPKANRVSLANKAYSGAMLFFDRGEGALATPLFRLALAQDTGASAELSAAEYLALMRGDLTSAATQARHDMERYNYVRSATRYLTYRFLLGESSAVWRDFDQLEPRFGEADLWDAAFMAHRLAEANDAAIEDFVMKSAAYDTRNNYLSRALRERYAFMALLIDRPVSREALAILDRASARFNHSYFYHKLADGYFALRTGDYARARQLLAPISADLTGISANTHESKDEVLPYLTLVDIKLGKRDDAIRRLEAYRRLADGGFDYHVAAALLAGYDGKKDAAITSLWHAFHNRPATGTRSFFPGYLLIEACEFLYHDTHDAAYRELIVEFARRESETFPNSWAYAAQAKYATSSEQRQAALARALHLDPRSERLAGFSTQERTRARDWFQSRGLFEVGGAGRGL